MHALQIDIHHLAPDTAAGVAERLGFVLPWTAHSLHGAWTVSVPPTHGVGLEPGAFDIVTDEDWPAFEAAIGRTIHAVARSRTDR